jgi:hypothetical protein
MGDGRVGSQGKWSDIAVHVMERKALGFFGVISANHERSGDIAVPSKGPELSREIGDSAHRKGRHAALTDQNKFHFCQGRARQPDFASATSKIISR